MEKTDIVNSCRVCRTENQDGDFDSLYVEQTYDEGRRRAWKLTEAGKLYEEMLGMQIEESSLDFYPRYLCPSCDLQIRLFKKLKAKAYKSLELLQSTYPRVPDRNEYVDCMQKTKTAVESKNLEHVTEKYKTMPLEKVIEETGTDINMDSTHDELKAEETDNGADDELENANEEAEEVLVESLEDSEEEFITDHERGQQMKIIQLANNETFYLTSEEHLTERHTGGADNNEHADKHSGHKEFKLVRFYEHDLQDVSGNEENYEEDRCEEEDEGGEQYREEERAGHFVYADHDNDQNYGNIQYVGVDYLEDVETSNTKVGRRKHRRSAHRVKRTYQCKACDIDFLRRIDFLHHRKEVHANKHPCPECSKLLHTSDALRVHLQLHRGLPPYKCNLCPKTFNQKVHYQYHMDKHNNVRNFQCEQCQKAFLSKTDLAMHTRTHTGERPYACEICGKDFMLLQHLKMHRYSHFGKSFECKECRQKFISPSTLRTHMQTIHNGEPQYQCEFCVKRFRRKHHLIAHYKVHQKAKASSSADEFIEENYNTAPYQENEHEQREEGDEEGMSGINDFVEIGTQGQIDGILVIDDDEHVIYSDGNVIAVEADVDPDGAMLL